MSHTAPKVTDWLVDPEAIDLERDDRTTLFGVRVMASFDGAPAPTSWSGDLHPMQASFTLVWEHYRGRHRSTLRHISIENDDAGDGVLAAAGCAGDLCMCAKDALVEATRGVAEQHGDSIVDEQDAACGSCSGSGEGSYDGSRCSSCGGSGCALSARSYAEDDDDDDGERRGHYLGLSDEDLGF